MDVRLIVKQGPALTRLIRLPGRETVVGRQKGCGLRIPAATVSRRHCLLSFQDGRLTVEDLDSANGTFLNGRRITREEVVRPGDRLEIGPLVFQVEYDETPATPELEPVLIEDAGLEEVEEYVEVLAVEDGDVETGPINPPSPLRKVSDAAAGCLVVKGIPVSEDPPVARAAQPADHDTSLSGESRAAANGAGR